MSIRNIKRIFIILVAISFLPSSHAEEWPKIEKALKKSDFVIYKDHSKLPAGIKIHGLHDVPHIARRDLNFDGVPELIVVHHGLASTFGPRHYIYKKKGPKYISIGYLDQASKIVILKPYKGYAQLELWTPGGEGGDPTFAKRLVRINKDGKYVHYRIDMFRPGKDGRPIYINTHYYKQ